jgi:uncharacterized protein (DUF433 family)
LDIQKVILLIFIKLISINLRQHIELNNQVMLGKAVVKGSRITVELILEKLSTGETMRDILIAHPHITQNDIYAALKYAAELVAKAYTQQHL